MNVEATLAILRQLASRSGYRMLKAADLEVGIEDLLQLTSKMRDEGFIKKQNMQLAGGVNAEITLEGKEELKRLGG